MRQNEAALPVDSEKQSIFPLFSMQDIKCF